MRQIWRKVNGMAIACGDCAKNQIQLGGDDICTAEDEICIFMNKKIDSQKNYKDFHEVFKKDEENVEGEAES